MVFEYHNLAGGSTWRTIYVHTNVIVGPAESNPFGIFFMVVVSIWWSVDMIPIISSVILMRLKKFDSEIFNSNLSSGKYRSTPSDLF